MGHDSIVITLWKRKVKLRIWEEDEEYLSNSTSLVKTCEKSNSNDNDTDKYTDTDTDTAN